MPDTIAGSFAAVHFSQTPLREVPRGPIGARSRAKCYRRLIHSGLSSLRPRSVKFHVDRSVHVSEVPGWTHAPPESRRPRRQLDRAGAQGRRAEVLTWTALAEARLEPATVYTAWCEDRSYDSCTRVRPSPLRHCSPRRAAAHPASGHGDEALRDA